MRVPQILMVDASEGVLGIEWIEGQCVRKLLPGGEEPEEGEVDPSSTGLQQSLEEYGLTIGKLMEMIGAELAKLHRADIVHGDLTTSNMMLRHPSAFTSSTKQDVPTELVRKSPQLLCMALTYSLGRRFSSTLAFLSYQR